MLRWVALFGVIVSLASPPLLAAGPEPLPTQEQIKGSLDGGLYPQALQQLQRVLILKGKAAQPYDRHALLRMKGEAHLRLKAGSAAASAFAEAAKETTDGPSVAIDLATETVIRRANAGLAYQPKLKDPTDKTKTLPTIDIVEPESRKKAIEALFADEWSVIEPKVAALRQAKSVPQIMSALPAIRSTRWLELASSGKDDKTRGLVADIMDSSKKIIETTLKEMATTVDELEQITMQVTTARVPVTDKQTGKVLRFDVKYKYRGPTSKQLATLKDIFGTASSARDACDELGGTLGKTGTEFNGTKATADQLRTKSGIMLDRDWNLKYDQPPATPPPPK